MNDLIQKALLQLTLRWGCDLTDLRPVKGDDRVLVYRRRSQLYNEWPCLPEACIQREDDTMVSITLIESPDTVTYRREYVL